MSASAPIRRRRSIVHFGIGPWLGLLAAVADRRAAPAPFIGFLAFRFGVAGVYFAILTIAFAEFARIGFDHLGWIGGSAGLFLPVAQYAHNDLWHLRGQPVMFYYVAAGADGARLRALPRAAAQPRRLFLAGDPRGRGGGARAPASTPSATRCWRCVISAGDDRRSPACSTPSTTTTCFPSRSSTSRARSRSSWGRSSAASARCSGRSSAPSC